MTMLKWITKDTNIDFMKARGFTYALSAILVVLSFLSMYFKGFNFGIDFSGGVLMEIKSEQPINVEEIRSKLSVLNLDELNLQTIGEKGDELMIRAQAENADEAAQRKAVVDIKNILGNSYEYRRVENVGPQVGDELKTAGIVASVLAMIAIAISSVIVIYTGNQFARYTGADGNGVYYFAISLLVTSGIYFLYFAATYIGFKRNVNE